MIQPAARRSGSTEWQKLNQIDRSSRSSPGAANSSSRTGEAPPTLSGSGGMARPASSSRLIAVFSSFG